MNKLTCCSVCQGTNNSKDRGGNDLCFHCGDCDYVQCIETCPDPTEPIPEERAGREGGEPELIAILKAAALAVNGEAWHACGEGNCKCRTVSSKDGPVCDVTHGKWGYEYPSLRLSGDWLNKKAEAFIDMIEYGEITEELAAARTKFIAAASPENILKLISILERGNGER